MKPVILTVFNFETKTYNHCYKHLKEAPMLCIQTNKIFSPVACCCI